jgi:hypothetical protein
MQQVTHKQEHVRDETAREHRARQRGGNKRINCQVILQEFLAIYFSVVFKIENEPIFYRPVIQNQTRHTFVNL